VRRVEASEEEEERPLRGALVRVPMQHSLVRCDESIQQFIVNRQSSE
jgi:hypothetical protein